MYRCSAVRDESERWNSECESFERRGTAGRWRRVSRSGFGRGFVEMEEVRVRVRDIEIVIALYTGERLLIYMKFAYDLDYGKIPAFLSTDIDGFVSWTLQSARNLGIPQIAFYGMSNYSMAVQRNVGELVRQKEEQGSSVLYVTFGSLAEISKEQFREISKGLEESEVNFLWVVRKNEEFDFVNEFEERVRERGMIVREWVNQRESMCAKVPVLARLMVAGQQLNAKMVVKEIKIWLKVEGSRKGFVSRRV
ncbi:hypothetical protein LguiA_029946 [Lonicera macranthoides]